MRAYVLTGKLLSLVRVCAYLGEDASCVSAQKQYSFILQLYKSSCDIVHDHLSMDLSFKIPFHRLSALLDVF
jgi:hypothetical protein